MDTFNPIHKELIFWRLQVPRFRTEELYHKQKEQTRAYD